MADPGVWGETPPFYDPIKASQEDGGVLLECCVKNGGLLRKAALRVVARGVVQPGRLHPIPQVAQSYFGDGVHAQTTVLKFADCDVQRAVSPHPMMNTAAGRWLWKTAAQRCHQWGGSPRASPNLEEALTSTGQQFRPRLSTNGVELRLQSQSKYTDSGGERAVVLQELMFLERMTPFPLLWCY